jgi:dTDP-4-dehydrorhamnose reductase
MKFLILGASGLVGGNCMKVFSKAGHQVLGTYFSYSTAHTVYYNTLDITDAKNADIKDFQPDVIVHCGALTHVDYCETHEEESYLKTVTSTLNALALCKQLGAKMVYLSTDYVFDGKKGFYTEVDEVNPLSIYAKHKLKAEVAVQQSNIEHLIVRITNVYGDEERGKNFISRLIENMEKAEPMELRLPYDQYATPANAWDIARGILQLIEAKSKGVFHFGSTDYLNRVQLAQKVMNYFGHSGVSLVPISTADMNQPAARPLKGGFDSSKFMSAFPSFVFHSVDDYLNLRKKGLNSESFGI